MILYFFTGRHSWDRRSRSQRANSCNISSPDQCQSLDHMLAPTCDLGREAKEPLQRKMCRLFCLSDLSKDVPPLFFVSSFWRCAALLSPFHKKLKFIFATTNRQNSIDDHDDEALAPFKCQSYLSKSFMQICGLWAHIANSLVRFIIFQSV